MTTETKQNMFAEIRDCAHPGCVVCSPVNAEGLHLKFDVDNHGSIQTTLQCDKAFEGYPGIMHGGVISSILDGAMGNCMFAHGLATVTVEITIRFRHPVIIGQTATVSAKITRMSHPLYLLEAQLIQDGKVKAAAKGKYYDQPKLIGSN